jgi:hypothetical protein
MVLSISITETRCQTFCDAIKARARTGHSAQQHDAVSSRVIAGYQPMQNRRTDGEFADEAVAQGRPKWQNSDRNDRRTGSCAKPPSSSAIMFLAGIGTFRQIEEQRFEEE